MAESVQTNSAVLVHFTLKLEDGSTAESTRANGKPALFRLGDETLSPGLEDQLVGLKAGDKKAFSLAPEAAFGIPSPDMIQYFAPRVCRSMNLNRAPSCSLPLWMAAKCRALCAKLTVIRSPSTLTIRWPGRLSILILKCWKLIRSWRR